MRGRRNPEIVPLKDAMTVASDVTPLTAVELRETHASLREALLTLKPRARMVLELRFGFYDGRIWVLREIGEIFGVTQERIRQIEAKALRKFRHPSRRELLRECGHLYDGPMPVYSACEWWS